MAKPLLKIGNFGMMSFQIGLPTHTHTHRQLHIWEIWAGLNSSRKFEFPIPEDLPTQNLGDTQNPVLSHEIRLSKCHKLGRFLIISYQAGRIMFSHLIYVYTQYIYIYVYIHIIYVYIYIYIYIYMYIYICIYQISPTSYTTRISASPATDSCLKTKHGAPSTNRQG